MASGPFSGPIEVEVELPGEAQVRVTMPWSRAEAVRRDLHGLNSRSASSDELLARLDESIGSGVVTGHERRRRQVIKVTA